MPRRFSFALLVFAMIAGSVSASAASISAVCTPSFPLEKHRTTGWLGADAAYSIPLDHGRDLWIFGDTLYGKQRLVQNKIPVMVRNSIGISTCDAHGRWAIQHIIRHDAQGKPQDFFTAQHPQTWYWAMDGFRNGNDLWITLLCVRASDAQSAMGFETCGTDLAHIVAPGPDPQAWRIEYLPLVANGAHAYPSAAAVVDGDYADLFALNESGSRSLVVTRLPLKGLPPQGLPLKGLTDPIHNLEYLAHDGKWRPGFDPANAFPVMTPGTSELSIRWRPELKRWLAVMFSPEAYSREILLRSAPSPTGPWSKGIVIYQAPEMTPGAAGYDKDTFCYAAKEHPEFERGDLVFTYVCNTMDVPKLATESNIYFPRVIRMPMPDDRAAKEPAQ